MPLRYTSDPDQIIYNMYIAPVGTSDTVLIPTAGNSNPQGQYRNHDSVGIEIVSLKVVNYQSIGPGANISIKLGTDFANTHFLVNSNVTATSVMHEWENVVLNGPGTNVTVSANIATQLVAFASVRERINAE